MELHTILKTLYKKCSREEFLSQKLIELINSNEDFDDEPKTVYMLSRMIEDDYLEHLIDTTEYNEDVLDAVVDDYNEFTGFESNYIAYVSKSVLYAIGLIRASQVTLEENDYYDYDEDYGVDKFYRDMSDDDFEEFILSKLDWNHSIEKKYGVEIYNMTVEPVNDYTGFNLIYLAKGKGKKEFVQMQYICYDINGKMRTVGQFYLTGLNKKIDKVKTVFVNFDRDLRKLGKIEFLIDD